MDKGFLKLSRKVFKHKYWTKERVFSEFEAWIDLIQLARFDEADHIEYIGSCEVRYGRGQLVASRRYLAERWTWGEGKVRTFLANLKKNNAITTRNDQGVTVVTLCNYEQYNTSLITQNQESSHAISQPKAKKTRALQMCQAKVSALQLTTRQPAFNPNLKKEKNGKKEDKNKTTAKACVAIVKQQAKNFCPPTVDEVESYCLQRNNEISPDEFVDFYESKGWMIGDNEMKDWRAAVRGWERRKNQAVGRADRHHAISHNNEARYEKF